MLGPTHDAHVDVLMGAVGETGVVGATGEEEDGADHVPQLTEEVPVAMTGVEAVVVGMTGVEAEDGTDHDAQLADDEVVAGITGVEAVEVGMTGVEAEEGTPHEAQL